MTAVEPQEYKKKDTTLFNTFFIVLLNGLWLLLFYIF